MSQINMNTPEQVSADQAWNYGRVTAEALYLRKSPSRKAARWNNVWPKDRIALIRPSFEDGWYETLYRGQRAFAMAGYIELIPEAVSDSIVERMLYMAEPELGRNRSIYFNGYNGAWCHRFADWLPMHAGLPSNRIPDVGNCAWGIVWFNTKQNRGGFHFKNQKLKEGMIRGYSPIRRMKKELTEEEQAYIPSVGDYVYFKWLSAKANTRVSHVAIVRQVSSSDIMTIEGNVRSRVTSRVFALDDPRIVGYGKPNYQL